MLLVRILPPVSAGSRKTGDTNAKRGFAAPPQPSASQDTRGAPLFWNLKRHCPGPRVRPSPAVRATDYAGVVAALVSDPRRLAVRRPRNQGQIRYAARLMIGRPR